MFPICLKMTWTHHETPVLSGTFLRILHTLLVCDVSHCQSFLTGADVTVAGSGSRDGDPLPKIHPAVGRVGSGGEEVVCCDCFVASSSHNMHTLRVCPRKYHFAWYKEDGQVGELQCWLNGCNLCAGGRAERLGGG